MSSTSPSTLAAVVRGILFDMDGVLVSSTGADDRSWHRWAALHGMASTFALASTHGRRTLDVVRTLRPDLDAAFEAERLEQFDAEDTEGLRPLPGVQQLLSTLGPEQWTVVTSASTRLMGRRLTLAGIALPLGHVTADLVTYGKPHPEPYQRGAALLGLAPADCLVIEDAPHGVAAGKAAGCRVLAVASSQSRAQLGAADWVVGSLEQVRVDQQGEGSLGIWIAQTYETGDGLGHPPFPPSL